MNDYFNHSTNVISNGTRATAAQVNNIAYEIGVGLDKLPTEAHIKRGTINYAADTGSADLYAVSLPYAPASYTDGMEVVFKAANSNTGACSMNVNSLGVKSIKRADGTDPAASEIPANKITTLRYNSTSAVFEIQNGAGYASSAAASATAAANSATAASGSATDASGYATAASNSATAASGSATSASASATAAASSATSAAASAALFVNVNAQVTASDEELSLLDGATVVGYNLGLSEFYGKTASVAAQTTSPNDFYVGNSGSSMYVLGGDVVYQYALSTAWDVSTASYASKSKSVAAQGGAHNALMLSADGTKMYVASNTTDTVYQYALSTAWDVSTASYASKSKSVAAQEDIPLGLAFSSNGTKMYVVGGTNATVYQYTLSTAWDVSTASYASKSKSVAAQDSSPVGLMLDASGAKLYIVGTVSDSVFQYDLSTAWDVSTASYASKSKSVAAQDTSASGLSFSADGTKMYVVGQTSDAVYQYNTGFIMPA